MVVKSKTDLIKEVRGKIEFAIMVAIFFSSLFYMASKAGGSSDIQANSNGLIWGIAVAIHILNYLLIDLSGGEIKKNWFAWIRASLILGILAFIPAILITVVYYNKALPTGYALTFEVSLVVALAMPVLTFFLICGHLDWIAIEGFWKMIKKKFSKR